MLFLCTFFQANFKGPVKGRSCTDCSFLVLFLFVLITLVSIRILYYELYYVLIIINFALFFQFGLVIYCTSNGDVNRLFYGFDECGDICGFKNKNPDPKFCAGKDMTNKP